MFLHNYLLIEKCAAIHYLKRAFIIIILCFGFGLHNDRKPCIALYPMYYDKILKK